MPDPLSDLLVMAAHTTPPTPLTVDHAHTAMRVHRTCTVDTCPHKAAAFHTLVAAGRLTPDSARTR
ncbi:hypothetical protein ACWEKT_03205 [Nocardia takedensis]